MIEESPVERDLKDPQDLRENLELQGAQARVGSVDQRVQEAEVGFLGAQESTEDQVTTALMVWLEQEE